MAAAVLKCKTLTERSWHVCITQVRYRKHIKVRNPPEPHFDRKCMLEVCKPIYKKEELSDWERCARRPQLLQERPIHPYHQLVAKKLKEEWKMARMICFFHCNPIKEEEKKSVRNMLFKKDLHLHHYPTDVITLGLKGTPTETALHLWDPHSALVYSTEPNVATLLKLSKKMPQYILLGTKDFCDDSNPTVFRIPIRYLSDGHPVSLLGKSIQQLNYERNNSDFPLVLFHTDAAQALGKISVNVATLHVDYLTIVGHKFYGPRIGALYFNSENNVKISPMFYGGGQERGYRPGTENTGMIAGLGKAAELVTEKLTVYQNNMKNTRNYLEKRLKNVFGETICFNNHRNAEILPNTCSVAFKNETLEGQCILEMTRNIQASVGAACHSNSKDQSILVASGVLKELSTNTLRLSTGRETTEDDIDKAVCYLQATVQKLCSYAN